MPTSISNVLIQTLPASWFNGQTCAPSVWWHFRVPLCSNTVAVWWAAFMGNWDSLQDHSEIKDKYLPCGFEKVITSLTTFCLFCFDLIFRDFLAIRLLVNCTWKAAPGYFILNRFTLTNIFFWDLSGLGNVSVPKSASSCVPSPSPAFIWSLSKERKEESKCEFYYLC